MGPKVSIIELFGRLILSAIENNGESQRASHVKQLPGAGPFYKKALPPNLIPKNALRMRHFLIVGCTQPADHGGSLYHEIAHLIRFP